VSCELV